jgi:hypothetical protein
LVAALGLTLAAAGCAAHHFSLPAGATSPAPDGVAAWEQAAAACRSASTYAAEIRVRGRVAAGKLNGTLVGVLTGRNDLYLKLIEPFGPPGFVLNGPAARATLVLPRDKRVLTAPAADIIEALTGLRLDPRELMAVLGGCVIADGTATGGQQIGDARAVAVGPARVWLRRVGRTWQVFAGERPGLVIEYRRFAGGWPAEIGISSPAGAGVPLDLRVSIDQVDLDGRKISPAAFVPDVPAGATPMTLEELRAMGPLGEKKG